MTRQFLLKTAALYILISILTGAITAQAGEVDRSKIKVTASSSEKKTDGGFADFPAEATLDGDLSPKSSWRAEGEGQWIQWDLGEVLKLKELKIGFLKGDSRKYTFEIKVSKSGKSDDWASLIAKGESDGQSKEMQTFSIKPTEARYVKLIGYGNTHPRFPKWINITEATFVTE